MPRQHLWLAVLFALGLGACAVGRGARPDCDPDPAPGVLGSICGFSNPEDLEWLPAHGLLLTAEFRRGGALVGLPVDESGAVGEPRRLWPVAAGAQPPAPEQRAGDPDCPGPPASDAFLPHGLSSAPAGEGVTRVAVVGHGPPDAVHFFDFEERPPDVAVRWLGCVEFPPETSGNDVALAPDGELVATNFAPVLGGLTGFYYQVKGLLGLTTGDLLAWSPGRGWRHLAGTSGPVPNGVVLSADGATVLYADNGRRRVAWLPRAGLEPSARPSAVAVGGPPDNVTLTPRGTLLTVVATLSGDFPYLCGLTGSCRIGWSLIEVDPARGTAVRILDRDGSLIGSATSALEVHGRIFIGTMEDDRLGVLRREAELATARTAH